MFFLLFSNTVLIPLHVQHLPVLRAVVSMLNSPLPDRTMPSDDLHLENKRTPIERKREKSPKYHSEGYLNRYRSLVDILHFDDDFGLDDTVR